MFGFRGLNLFMFLLFYSVLPILYVTFRNECKPKKGIMLGVTLPAELICSDEAKAIGERYKGELGRWMLILTLLGLPAVAVRSVSVSMTWDMVWMLAVIVVPQLIYVRGWRRLRQLKMDQGCMTKMSDAEPVMVDMAAIRDKHREPSPWWYVPPMIMSFIPCVLSLNLWGNELFWWMEFTWLSLFGCVVLLFGITYRAFRHQKVEMINRQTELTVALTRVRRYNWHKMMLSSAWLTGAYTLALYFVLDRGLWMLTISMVYMVVLVVLAVQTEFAVRRAQESLTAKFKAENEKDEDEYWLWGFIYYNPKDKRTMINARTGMNMTFNLATGLGKGIGVFVVLLLLSLPLFGVWMMAEEFTPVKARIEDQVLVIDHLKEEYAVPLEEMTEVQLIYELPGMRKQLGSNMDNLYKGQFMVEGYGECQLCLNPTGDEFVVISTEEERYMFSLEADLRDELLAWIK